MSDDISALVARAKADLYFDRENLDETWANHAVLFLTYAHQLSLAETEVSRTKGVLEQVEAKLSAKHRADISLRGTRPTESMIDAKIKSDPAYIRCRVDHDQARSTLELQKSIVEAFRHRRDMIVQASKREILEFERLGESSFMGKRK